jgi:hypothetical protein
MKMSAAVLAAVLLLMAVLAPVYGQQAPAPKASPETEVRKQEAKGDGTEVRKKAKKKSASPPAPKASPETEVRKQEAKGDGTEVRKKAKKKSASPPAPKASPETEVRKGEQKKQQ